MDDIMEQENVDRGVGLPVKRAFEELIRKLGEENFPYPTPANTRRYKPEFPKYILRVNEHTTANIIEQERPNIIVANIESNDRDFLLIAIPLTPYPEEGGKR